MQVAKKLTYPNFTTAHLTNGGEMISNLLNCIEKRKGPARTHGPTNINSIPDPRRNVAAGFMRAECMRELSPGRGLSDRPAARNKVCKELHFLHTPSLLPTISLSLPRLICISYSYYAIQSISFIFNRLTVIFSSMMTLSIIYMI